MNTILTVYDELTALVPPEALIAITIVSVVMFFGTILLIPVIIIRLPVDYFLHDEEHVWLEGYHPVLRYTGLIIKNTVGLVFLLAGIAMLVLPGQGLLTMVIGVSLLDFPGKRAIEHRLLTKPMVFNAMNAIRQKFDKPPFSQPV